MAGLRHHTLLDGNDLFVEFKGALTEQYVCQQLKTIEDLDILSRKILTRSFCSHLYGGLQKEEWLVNLPLYAIDQITQI